MKKTLSVIFSLVMIGSMLLAACAPTATPEPQVEPTKAPEVVEPTKAPEVAPT